MLKKQRRNTFGAFPLNTAQVLIFVIALGCVYVVFNAYQQAHQPPPLTLTDVSPKPDLKQARYAAQVQAWQAKMAQRQMIVTWPYLGQNNVVRIDLPPKVPITLADWDVAAEEKVAADAYRSFHLVRIRAKVASPGGCIVHVFSADAVEVATASASGAAAVTS